MVRGVVVGAVDIDGRTWSVMVQRHLDRTVTVSVALEDQGATEDDEIVVRLDPGAGDVLVAVMR